MIIPMDRWDWLKIGILTITMVVLIAAMFEAESQIAICKDYNNYAADLNNGLAVRPVYIPYNWNYSPIPK